MMSNLLNLLRHVLWPSIWSILKNVPCILEKYVYSAVFGQNILQISVRSSCCVVLFTFSISLLIFCPVILAIFLKLIIFWGLHWVFVAMHRLSLVERAGATLRYSAQASHCSGFSCRGAWAVGAQASVDVARRLSSCGSQAPEHRLSNCGTWAQLLCSMWNLP